MQAIDHVVNSAAKTFYMSAGAVPVPIGTHFYFLSWLNLEGVTFIFAYNEN